MMWVMFGKHEEGSGCSCVHWACGREREVTQILLCESEHISGLSHNVLHLKVIAERQRMRCWILRALKDCND